MTEDAALRKHLVELLRAESAHVAFDDVIAEWPAQLRGRKTEGIPYSPWQILEHMRIAQWDILEFSRDPKHVSPDWPQGYWPESEAPASDQAWQESVEAFRRELREMETLVQNPAIDLFERIPHGQGQTILREALVVADHNAYHLGQLVLMRRLLGAWPVG